MNANHGLWLALALPAAMACLTTSIAVADEPSAPAPHAVHADDGTLRDPFWPIGYVPKKPETNAVPADVATPQEVVWPKLELRGLTKNGDQYMALLDRIGLVTNGANAQMVTGGLRFTWKIVRIDENGVASRRVSVAHAKPGDTVEEAPRIVVHKGVSPDVLESVIGKSGTEEDGPH